MNINGKNFLSNKSINNFTARKARYPTDIHTDTECSSSAGVCMCSEYVIELGERLAAQTGTDTVTPNTTGMCTTSM